ncbi:urea ABC transporter, ATP-binding protein UrtD [Rubidibacter lacunae KORDI 51-2]|uniref:Urea ABC transporter, ATP-binding protein UrtD n=1 Tax=Rubidibacter lacunae KORDI 51-2 TaxID=582515 RepID=U5DLF3_9CHRO|nr:urea ABC transporter ATP-binding protein UrtD [Rubidibacter lacunae]ERN40545.1 urea ABC transporter, ATP-binding protein UrtD [Rubidibacter lacunae KORDI 51-2]
MTDTILATEHLTVSFDGFKALNDLNFSLAAGELRVVIGPNGAGKTTFLDVITGKVQPTEGRVLFKGQDLRGRPEHKIARLGIGRKFQTPRVYLQLTTRENLDLACNRNKGVFSTLFGQAAVEDKRRTIALLETIGLSAKADMRAQFLSHGEKQRLEIGMLVAQSPDLLLVDEPVAGLTDEETENVGNLLLALAESHSLIVIEHDMEFVRQIARQVTVLHQGSVLCEGSIETVQNDPRTIEVYLGQAPTISPEQLKVLRIVASLAWSDGNLTSEEEKAILERLSRVFAQDIEQQQELQRELRDYLAADLGMDALAAELKSTRDRELVLKLGYEVILAHARRSHEPHINEYERRAYEKLVGLLEFDRETVARLEAEVEGDS